jgi:hypothetical protein
MATASPGRKRRSYLPVDIEQGVQALVTTGGSAWKASKLCGIPEGTLDKWKTIHRGRIEEVRRERGPELERAAIEGFRAFVIRAEDVKAMALEALREQIADGKCSEPGRALQQVSIAQGIATQRMLELDGRPSGVKPERSLAELLNTLRGVVDQAAVDGTAVEEPKELLE